MVSRLEKYMKKEAIIKSTKRKKEAKIKTKKLPTIYPIVVDHRERDSKNLILLDEIAKEFKMEIKLNTAQLDEGDYRSEFEWEAELDDTITKKVKTFILVELKANLNDATQSNFKGRLKGQFEKLCKFEEDAYDSMIDTDYIVEVFTGFVFIGDFEKLRRENKPVWKGFISFAAECNKAHIPLWKAFDEEEFIRYFLKLFHYDFRKTQKHNIIRNFPKNIEIFARQLMGIPHIGQENALRIAEYCPNGYEDLVSFSIDNLQKIPNIGPKTAIKLYYYIRNKSIPNKDIEIEDDDFSPEL